MEALPLGEDLIQALLHHGEDHCIEVDSLGANGGYFCTRNGVKKQNSKLEKKTYTGLFSCSIRIRN
jgi:hypothetical protein